MANGRTLLTFGIRHWPLSLLQASVELGGIRPGREPGHAVELAKEAAHQLVGVVLRAQRLEPGQDPGDRGIGIGDGALGVVLPLLRETLAVLEKLFPIEIRRWNMFARNPPGAD